MGQAVPVVELKGITKRFPGIVANDSISLQLRKGEIHALLGENGAGKSTLMSILFGLYQPDEGEIHINGTKETIDGPGKAIKLGIGMVHQHFKLVQNFTVAENIVLGIEPKKQFSFKIGNKNLRINKPSIHYRNANDRVQKLSEQYGLKVDPRVQVQDITVGMQQRVEILKTLYRGAEILIFDEPTAVLTVQEIQELMQILRNLAAEGKSIILITHKLKEIMEVSDRVTVIRRGKVIDSLITAETNESELAEKMVGRRVSFELEQERCEPGETLVKIDNLTLRGSDKSKNILENITFNIRAGEIYGLAGVDGNGQRELVEAISGIRQIHEGSVTLGNVELTKASVRERMVAGIAQIPEDRQKHGLVLDFKVSENMVLTTYKNARFGKNGFLNGKEIDLHADKLTKEFDVRSAGIHVAMRSLSGGNQQKAIIARELTRDPQLLIAVQPTRGLDIGAIEFVHKRLLQAKNEGKAILLISYELDELYKMSDRIAVINEGRIMGELDREEVDDEKLGLMMAGNSLGAKGGGAA